MTTRADYARIGRLRKPARLLIGVCLVSFIAFVLLAAANLILFPVPDDCDAPCGSSLGISLAIAGACLALAFLVLVAVTISWAIVAGGIALWRRARR